MTPIRYAITLIISIQLAQCASMEERQAIAQKDFDTFSSNWKQPDVDYNSIPINPSETYGKPILVPTTSVPPTSLIGHTLAFSPDSNYILIGALSSKTFKLCNISGSEIRSFEHSEIGSLAFSSNGKYILSLSRGKEAILWDLNGNKIKAFKNTWDVAFSPNSQYVLVAGIRGDNSDVTALWDLNGNKIRLFGNAIYVSFSPDGKYILTVVGSKSEAILWDLEGNQVKTLDEFGYFSPDGKFLLSPDGKLLDLDGNKIRKFETHKNWDKPISISPDGKYVLTTMEDYSVGVTLRDINGNRIRDFKKARTAIFALNGKYILTASDGGSTELWDINGNKIRRILGETGRIRSVNMSPDGKQLLSVKSSYKIAELYHNEFTLWNFDRNEMKTIQHPQVVNAIFSPDGKYILSWGDLNVKLWDSNGTEIRTFSKKSSYGDKYAFSPDGKNIFVNYFGGGNELLNLNGIRIASFPKNFDVNGIYFSPDGKSFLTSSGQFLDFDGNVIKNIKTYSTGPISPDGKYTLDRYGDLWDLEGNKIRTIGVKVAGREKSSIFSPDGKFILSEDEMQHWDEIILWDIDGNKLETLHARSAAFSTDGNYFIVGGMDNTIKISSVDRKKWITVSASEAGTLVYTNDGRFDYSGESMKSLVNFRKGGTNELITLDSLFDEFYTPGLLSQFFSGKGNKKPKIDIEDIFKKSPIPQVTTNTNSGESESTTGMANVTVTACDRGGGEEDIRLYHNNALVDLEATRGIKINSSGKCQTKAFDVALFPGENSFRGSARNRENLWGYSDYLRLAWKPKEKTKPTQHLVVIGVNQYSGNTFSSLQYAVPDAKLFQESLVSKSRNLYGKTEVYELYDEAATREGIRTLLKNVATKVKPENGDVLILFFAGHGVNVDNQYYFIPAKYSGDASKSALDSGAFPQTMLVDLVSAIHAEKKLIVLDSCQSGGSEWEGSIGRFSHASGVGIIAAAQSVQFALESSKFGHGLLTYSISDEIKNGQREKDGKLYLNILASRVKRAVEKLAAERKHKQDPYTMIKSDFELAE